MKTKKDTQMKKSDLAAKRFIYLVVTLIVASIVTICLVADVVNLI